MHTPSIAFRHLCRKPVFGVSEPCSHRDEQVGQALFVQGTQHCAFLGGWGGCGVGGGGDRAEKGEGGGDLLVTPVSQRGSYDSIIWCP